MSLKRSALLIDVLVGLARTYTIKDLDMCLHALQRGQGSMKSSMNTFFAGLIFQIFVF